MGKGKGRGMGRRDESVPGEISRSLNKIRRALEYLLFRIHEYFLKKKGRTALEYTVYFVVILEASLIVPFSLVYRIFAGWGGPFVWPDPRMRFYVAILIAVVLGGLSNVVLRKYLSPERLEQLYRRYHKETYKLPIWVIFGSPVFFMFICPVLYGLINGTLRVFGHPVNIW